MPPLRVFLLLCSSAIVVACGGTTTTELGGPVVPRCETSLHELPPSVGASGGRITGTVVTSRDCEWTLRSDASWVEVNPATGQGEASITLIVSQNTVAADRTATIEVNSTRVALTQEAAPCRYELNRSAVEVPAAGGALIVGVSAVDGCSWTASSSALWLQGVRTSSRGSGTAEFIAGANSGTSRTGTLTIAGIAVSVTQDGAQLPSPGPGPSPTPAPTPPAPAPEPTPTPSPTPAPPQPGPAPTPTPSPPPAPPAPTPPPAVAEFAGAVSGLSGECPSVSFLAAGRRVITNEATVFNGGNCRQLQNGTDVEVTGVSIASGDVRANRIRFTRN